MIKAESSGFEQRLKAEASIDLSVVIVNFKVALYTVQCVESVLAVKGDLTLEVIVVDNASPDASVAVLREAFPADKFPQIHIIANPRNIGFGRANNIAVEQALGRYILFLNPDTLVAEETLAACMAAARNEARLGAIGVMQLNPDGTFAKESRRGVPTPWNSLCKTLGLTRLLPHSRLFAGYYMGNLPRNAAAPIEIVSGAYMFCSREALREVGLFDEEFFMYGEDIDLSYRLRRASFTNLYVPVPILHYKGESTRKTSFSYVHAFFGAMLIFFRKHYRHTSIFLSVPIRCAILLKALLAIVHGQLKSLKNFMFPGSEASLGRHLYIGPNGRAFEKLAREYGLDFTIADLSAADVTQESVRRILPTSCRHIVFDASVFSRSFMLSFMQASNHRLRLGIYYPETETLITQSAAFSFR